MNGLSSIYDDPRLLRAYEASQQATQEANVAGQTSLTLPDMLREALTKKFSMDNPLMAQRESALKNYLTSTTEAPLSVTQQKTGGIILSPLEQSNLIQQRTARPLASLSSANAMLGLQTGGMEDIIDAASRAYQASALGRQQTAQTARQGYTDILTELSNRADEAYRQKQLQQQWAIAQSKQKGDGMDLAQKLAIYRLMKPSAETAKDARNAESGLRSVEQLRTILTKHPNVLKMKETPVISFFHQPSRQFGNAAKEAYDVLMRTRTGAALNMGEEVFYRDYIPNWGESEDTIEIKFKRLEDLFNNVKEAGTIPDLLQFLRGTSPLQEDEEYQRE